MATQPTFKPKVSGKNAVTGKGTVSKAPQSGAMGPSNHVPKIGADPAANYSSEQQQ